MSEPAKTAFDMARTLLNDDGVQLWTDAVLRTKLQTAHRELQIQLRANACPITRKTEVVQVNVRDTSIPNPSDIIEPIALWERGLNEFDSQFQRMTESDPLPITTISDRLIYWRWTEETIEILGSDQARMVKINYKRLLPIPVKASDPLGIIDGENYLGPRIAALAFGSTGNTQTADWCTNMATATLGDILQANRGRSRQVPRS